MSTRKTVKRKGMLVSILDDFAEQMGIRTEYAFCERNDEEELLVAQKKYDIVAGLPFTAALCAKLGIVRSETILDSTLAYAQIRWKKSGIPWRRCAAWRNSSI